MRARCTIKDLIALAPPPESRVDAGSLTEWDRVERELRTSLPADYKQLVNVYGSGEFNDLFYVFNPFSGSESMNLLWQAGVPDSFMRDEELGRVYPLGSMTQDFEQMRVEFPELCLPSLYPEPSGLLPLGGDTNGGYAFWRTEGQPNEWPVLLYPADFEPVEQHSTGLVDFLVRWLSGELPDCFHGVGRHFVKRTDPVFSSG